MVDAQDAARVRGVVAAGPGSVQTEVVHAVVVVAGALGVVDVRAVVGRGGDARRDRVTQRVQHRDRIARRHRDAVLEALGDGREVERRRIDGHRGGRRGHHIVRARSIEREHQRGRRGDGRGDEGRGVGVGVGQGHGRAGHLLPKNAGGVGRGSRQGDQLAGARRPGGTRRHRGVGRQQAPVAAAAGRKAEQTSHGEHATHDFTARSARGDHIVDVRIVREVDADIAVVMRAQALGLGHGGPPLNVGGHA